MALLPRCVQEALPTSPTRGRITHGRGRVKRVESLVGEAPAVTTAWECAILASGGVAGWHVWESTVDLFGIGTNEMIVIALLAVVLFGERLPEVARAVARISRQLQKVSREFRDALRLDE